MSRLSDDRAQAALWDGLRGFAVLPEWLSAATDPTRVAQALNKAVPQLAAGEVTIAECDIGQVRIKRDVWTGTYRLTLRDHRDDKERVVALRGTIIPPNRPAPAADRALGEDGWRSYLPELRVALEPQPPDAALPALPLLTDAEQARQLLERTISAAAPGYRDLRIDSCSPKVMRYTPGSRCTVLYRLAYPAGLAEGRNWPEIVVAKTYKGGKGEHAYASMRALWDSPFRLEGDVALAEPLGFLPDLNVLVQGPVREEQTLQELIATAVRSGTAETLDHLHGVVRRSAAGLAALHRSEVRHGAVRTWEDELAEVRSVVDDLASALPAHADAATPLLTHLDELAASQAADPVMPVHGTFRPGQVLIAQGAIGFIDFDSFCQAEPSLDLSLFLRRTKDIALSVMDEEADADSIDRPSRELLLARAEDICEVFLGEYERHVPVSRQRCSLWEALDLFTLVLHSWTKVKPTRLDNAMLALERHLHGLGL